ncbi:MAG: hypothetical protein HQL32_06555 [Planctomycetes bacterium]|nr:hypothetical protein [Planctomycetota bacterium]
MPSETSMLYTEAQAMEEYLSGANEVVSQITWEDHHPYYPKQIEDLMLFIAKSSWVFGDYRKHKLPEVMGKVESANIEQVKCALTTINRSEKWVTGSWKTHLEQNSLEPLIKRAIMLTEPKSFLQKLNPFSK